METKETKLSTPKEVLPLLSMFTILISLSISIEKHDLRPIGVGIILFGVLYFGSFSYWFYLMYKRDRDVMSIVTITMMLILAISLLLFGLALFLHHYDIDGLINFYSNIAVCIDKTIR
jgi:apolipoprotein N-acyltransferase